MSRTSLAAFLILTSAALPAQAQFNFVGPGSTVQGDYLRGMGAAAFGMGIYNHQTAIAESINADTMMRVNEYIYQSLMHENQLNSEYRAMIFKKHKEEYDKFQQRIKENPEARDVDKGTALNAVLRTDQRPQDPGVVFPGGRGSALGRRGQANSVQARLEGSDEVLDRPAHGQGQREVAGGFPG